MNEIRVSIEGLSQVLDRWDQAPEIFQEEFSAATWEASLLLEAEVQDRTPVGAHGALRNSINAQDPQISPDGILGIVGTSVIYAEAVELGSRPHWAPIAPLEEWVRMKLGVSAEEAESVARKVQFHIAAHGTPAYGMFHQAQTYTEPQVFEIYEQAADRVAKRLAE